MECAAQGPHALCQASATRITAPHAFKLVWHILHVSRLQAVGDTILLKGEVSTKSFDGTLRDSGFFKQRPTREAASIELRANNLHPT